MLRSERKLQFDACSALVRANAESTARAIHEVLRTVDAKPIAIALSNADGPPAELVDQVFWNAHTVVDDIQCEAIGCFYGVDLNVRSRCRCRRFNRIVDEIAQHAFEIQRLNRQFNGVIDGADREPMARA